MASLPLIFSLQSRYSPQQKSNHLSEHSSFPRICKFQKLQSIRLSKSRKTWEICFWESYDLDFSFSKYLIFFSFFSDCFRNSMKSGQRWLGSQIQASLFSFSYQAIDRGYHAAFFRYRSWGSLYLRMACRSPILRRRPGGREDSSR